MLIQNSEDPNKSHVDVQYSRTRSQLLMILWNCYREETDYVNDNNLEAKSFRYKIKTDRKNRSSAVLPEERDWLS